MGATGAFVCAPMLWAEVNEAEEVVCRYSDKPESYSGPNYSPSSWARVPRLYPILVHGILLKTNPTRE